MKATVALQLDKHPLLQPETGLDTSAYVELARRVVAGDLALGPGLYYVSPLYIYFLAVVYGATKSFTAVRIVQAALGTCAVLFVFLTAREWFGKRAAWIAAVLLALTGVVTWYETLLLQSSLDVALTALALWLLTLALRRDSARIALLAGVTFGVASLNRPNLFAAAVLIALLLVVLRRWRSGVLLAIGVVVGLAPVTLRNIVVANQWSLVSSHGGINFYIGNGEGATGYFHAVPGMRSTVEGLAGDARRIAEQAQGRRLTDAEVSSYYSGLAWRWIRAHPFAWIRLLLWKTYGVFNAAHLSIPFSYTFYAYDAGTLLRVLFIGPWLLIPLGLFGLATRRPLDRAYLAWLSFVPAYTASVVLFFITERYKLPLYVAFAIGAGAAVDALMTRERRRVAMSIAVLALLAIACNWPLGLDDGRTEERVRMAEHHARRGEVDEAERWTALALHGAIAPESIHYRVGAQYANSGRNAQAIEHLRQGAALPPVDYLFGRALLAEGRAAEAVPHLRRAVAARVEPLAGYDLASALQQTGDVAAAVDALRDVVPPRDAPAEVWLQLGRRAAELNAPDVAEPFLRRAVQLGPDNAAAHQLLGVDLLALGRPDEAARALSEAVRIQPGNAGALATLAFCEQQLGRIDDARRHAEAAIALDPMNPFARQVVDGVRR